MTIKDYAELLELCQGRTQHNIEYLLTTFYKSDIDTLSRALECKNDIPSVATAIMRL